ncbi:UvrD-helicase domain-containing protein [Flavobacterium branchiophilum]|uniref:DNA 3'-5' helicase n=1 Tax=Flavobacterium branchiophilum TaxID=55197 RepID=A0A2H3KAS4_9FLAO|nr:UvrD-helicase domain-containing protein [Flavobacterium branchiophilum]PDS22581.1 ATP-dependent helicase [Flavobacterium branchiophilum]
MEINKASFKIFNASAGSGKTYNLVKEYLKIILSSKKNDAYRNILAITFTNKAVHEMKSRIVNNLSDFAQDEPNAKTVALMTEIAAELSLLNKPLSVLEIKTKSQQIIKHLIHNYAAFDISTIDKFTHRVIRAFALDLGLSATFEVSLDTDNLLAEAVDSLIAQAGTDPVLTQLMVDFTMEKTDDDKSWDISNEILETGKLILNENNRLEIEQLQDITIPQFIEIKQVLWTKIKTLEAINVALAQQVFDFLNNHQVDLKSFSAQVFPKHLNTILANQFNNKNKKFQSESDFKINKTAKDKDLIESLLSQLVGLMKPIYDNYEKIYFHKAFLKNITPLSLLNSIGNELAKIQNEQNLLSISEFNAIIHREIQNQPAPFIYERLGERYKHFFIDEFQDTSEMQWQNLIPLINNATASEDLMGERGSLMIVGDPKQSIYRWRGGKAEQFIELSNNNSPNNNPFSNPSRQVTQLDTNFRSFSEVIQFNNDFFKMMANEFQHLDYKNMYENNSFQKNNTHTGGYVNITFINETTTPIDLSEDETPEDEVLEKTDVYVLETFQKINECIEKGFQYKDIAVLTRKRSHGVLIANYLTAQQIPIISSETLLLSNAKEVQCIIHVLRYLKNNNDKESKSRFLQYLAQYSQSEMEIHDFIAQGMSFETENEFEHWLAHFNLSFSFELIRKKSLFETVETIITHLIYQNTQDNSENAYLQFFLDIVLEREVKNQSGISDFLIFWEKKSDRLSIPTPEGNNSVVIMTIHKSKGLEFPVVIFPFAVEDYNRKPKDKLWITVDKDNFGLSKVLIDNSSAVSDYGLLAKGVYESKKQEEVLDNINVLYVALTRAEEQLYIITEYLSPKQSKNNDGEYETLFKNNMASYFIKFLIQKGYNPAQNTSFKFGTPIKLSTQPNNSKPNIPIPIVKQILDPKNIKISQKSAMLWGTNREESIAFGNVVHEILSFIKTAADIPFAIEKALNDGLLPVVQIEFVQNSIEQIVKHPKLSAYFNPQHIILNEKTIIGPNSQTLKPDRMEVTPTNKVLLLDYKTGSYDEKHLMQMNFYQQEIEKMGYSLLHKSLVYIGNEIIVLDLLANA